MRCSRRLSLPTLIDPTLKWKCSGMQRGCVGWAQRRQAASFNHMGEYYRPYGTFPETCTLVHHRPNLKMRMGRGRSHGQRLGNLDRTSGCGWGVPIRQTSVGSALASPGGKIFPKPVQAKYQFWNSPVLDALVRAGPGRCAQPLASMRTCTQHPR